MKKRIGRRIAPEVPITDPAREWIPAATHDAGSDEFRNRQRARMAKAQAAADAQRLATDAKVSTLPERKKA